MIFAHLLLASQVNWSPTRLYGESESRIIKNSPKNAQQQHTSQTWPPCSLKKKKKKNLR